MGIVNRLFYHVGKYSATHKCLVLTAFACITLIGSLGLINLKLEYDPQALWVSSTSRGNREQNYFKEKYGAFFRITQMIMKRKGRYDRDDSIDLFQKPYLEMIYHIQTAFEQETLVHGDRTFNITDICYKPITGKGCIATSPMEFWLMNLTDMWSDTNFKETARCIRPRVISPITLSTKTITLALIA
jgi:Niemann-Pick C1 protein